MRLTSRFVPILFALSAANCGGDPANAEDLEATSICDSARNLSVGCGNTAVYASAAIARTYQASEGLPPTPASLAYLAFNFVVNMGTYLKATNPNPTRCSEAVTKAIQGGCYPFNAEVEDPNKWNNACGDFFGVQDATGDPGGQATPTNNPTFMCPPKTSYQFRMLPPGANLSAALRAGTDPDGHPLYICQVEKVDSPFLAGKSSRVYTGKLHDATCYYVDENGQGQHTALNIGLHGEDGVAVMYGPTGFWHRAEPRDYGDQVTKPGRIVHRILLGGFDSKGTTLPVCIAKDTSRSGGGLIPGYVSYNRDTYQAVCKYELYGAKQTASYDFWDLLDPTYAQYADKNFPRDWMSAQDTLVPGDFIRSQNGTYKLIMKSNGDVGVFKNADDSGNGGNRLWNTNTVNTGHFFSLEDRSGKVVIYDNNPIYDSSSGKTVIIGYHELWEAIPTGLTNASMTMQNDGNLVVYHNLTGKAMWATGTNGK